jgi:uncharacterized lipoprotein YbaY
LAAVHVSAPRGRLSDDRLPVVVAEMASVGTTVSRQLGAPDDAVVTMTLDDVVAREQGRRAG